MLSRRDKRGAVHIRADLTWTVAQDPATGVWMGVCPALGLNALGDTRQELHEYAAEAMQLLFEDLYEEGDLDQFMRERGWKLEPEPTSGGKPPRFDVPFDVETKEIGDLVPA